MRVVESDDMNKSEIVAVMGLMGVGKSTVTELISDRLEIPIVKEDFSGNPFLDLAYSDPKNYAFPSQQYFLLAKAEGILQQTSNRTGLSIVDTPIEQDAYSYAKAHLELGNFTEDQWKLYEKHLDFFLKTIPATSAIIYLTASFGTVVERIKNRGRESEQNISIEYLALLERLTSELAATTTIPLLRVDTESLNLRDNSEDQEIFVGQVRDFIARTRPSI